MSAPWNSSNISSNSTKSLTKVELNIWITFQFGIGVIGAILIVVLLNTMSKLGKLKSGSGLLIAHSLTIDLTFCLIVSPVAVLPIYLTQSHITFSYDCVFVEFFLLLIIYAGNWTNVVLAVNRLIAVALPHFYTRITSRRFSTLLLVIVWVIAFACSIPTLNFVNGLRSGMLHSGACGLTQNKGATFTILGATGTYLPIVLLGMIYISLFLISRLMKGRGNLSTDTANEIHQRLVMKKRMSLAKALFLSYVWYCICILPPAVLNMFYATWWNKEIKLLLYTRGAQVLGYAASPVFFFAVNPEYRKSLRKRCIDLLYTVQLSHQKQQSHNDSGLVKIPDSAKGNSCGIATTPLKNY
ncbi:adenosine receptor A3-like [Paramacrobiotus metropolitanus]|uniref:adenosine receptor A3-like n=1 Tax=Paramacrobiotus metropolitanus TaxID=2943436 RepID=UPI0024465488|nr:adenosine receptor A3-like [Paramacrobiotus metropolitanus]